MGRFKHGRGVIGKPILRLSIWGNGSFLLFLDMFLLFAKMIGAGKAVNKSAASAASPDYVKFQAVIKSAASAASRKSNPGGCASSRLDHGLAETCAANQGSNKESCK